MLYEQLAIAMRLADYEALKPEFGRYFESADSEREVHGNDKYIVLYWDYADANAEDKERLMTILEYRRHALLSIREDGEIWRDVETRDSKGEDEDFEDLLGWKASICIWSDAEAGELMPDKIKF